GVARVHGDGAAVGPLHGAGVAVAVAGVDPAVEAQGEGVGHAVRVAGAVLAGGDLAFVGLARAGGVGQPPDVGDADGGGLLAGAGQGQHADGDVEPVGEGGDLAGPAVGAEVLQHLDGVAALAAGRRGEGVLDGVGDPQPALLVEGEVEGLVDVGLGGDQLGL